MIKIFIPVLFLVLSGCSHSQALVLNDVHSKLNETKVTEIIYPTQVEEISAVVKRARQEHKAMSISGGRHAMGGQQFGTGTIHLSMKNMDEVLAFDPAKGIVRVEAGITWPKLIKYLESVQQDSAKPWGIIQKQTGADQLTIGGSLSANAHGRGLQLKPMIDDVESFTLVDADGQILNVSRKENSELFKLVIGGYGLFGVIASVDLRLQQRMKLERKVEIIPIEQLPAKAKQYLDEGYLYGDFQYKTDEKARDFMRTGVLSVYRQVSDDTPIKEKQKHLTAQNWRELLLLGHINKAKAFEKYSQYYLTTNGQIYWSDEHQLSYYDDGYEEYLKPHIPDYKKGSLMITEIYVPRADINRFIEQIITDVREHKMNVIYGTMRLIKKDDESFLAWAKEDYACIIFNLRVEHSSEGKQKAAEDFKRMIDRALAFNGSFYLTYHRWARKDQLLQAYPQFVEFLQFKKKYDPEERFQSDWYRFYKKLFEKELQ